MSYLRCLQINKQEAFEDIVIKDKIDIILTNISFYALLTCHKGVSFPELENKFLQVVDYGRFEIGFRICYFLGESKKFGDIRVS